MKAILSIVLCSLLVLSCAHNKKHLPPKIDVGVIPGGTGNNWIYITNTSSHTIVEINNKSLNRSSGSLVYFQERFTFLNIENNVKFTINKAVIDCTKKKYASISTTAYDKMGHIIKSFDLTPSLMPISIGSVGMIKYQYLCTKSLRKLG